MDPLAKDPLLKRWRDMACGAGSEPSPVTKNDAAAMLDRVCAAERRLAEALDAIRWALGYDVGGEPFRPRKEGEGAYWWRVELYRRAGSLLDATPPASGTSYRDDGQGWRAGDEPSGD